MRRSCLITLLPLLVLGGGCGFRKTEPVVPKPVTAGEFTPACPSGEQEAAKPVTLPFLGDDVRPASTSTRDGLSHLFTAGTWLLLVGLLAGALLRSPQLMGAGAVGGGASLAFAVLFNEYPRTVLLIPVGFLALLVWMAVILWRASKRDAALSTIVETLDELDTGDRSAGRVVKNKLSEQPTIAERVRAGIEWIKKKLRINQ